MLRLCCATARILADSYPDSAERIADVLGCLQGVHIMPLVSANGEEEDGGVPEWVLAGVFFFRLRAVNDHLGSHWHCMFLVISLVRSPSTSWQRSRHIMRKAPLIDGQNWLLRARAKVDCRDLLWAWQEWSL